MSIRTGAKEEGACRVWSWNCTALARTAWMCQQCVQGRFQGTERWVGDWGTVLAPLHLPSLNTISIPYIFQELETHPRRSFIHMTFPRKFWVP